MNPTPDWNQLIEDAPQNEREAAYHACWMVALCDGRLWRERRLLDDIAAELRLDKRTARAIEKKARRGRRKFDEPTTDAGRRVLFHFTLEVAAVDGRLSDDERQYAYRCGRHFGLSNEDIDAELTRLIPEKYRPRVRRIAQPAQRTGNASRTVTSERESGSASSLVEGMRADAVQAGKLHEFTNYVLPFLLMVGAHLVPVIGALFWQWEIPTILMVYWGETVVVGLFSAFKITLSLPSPNQPKPLTNLQFFCIHYGMFTLAHGVVVLMIALGSAGDSSDAWTTWFGEQIPGILLAVGAIAIEHAVFFYVDFIREEHYKRTTEEDHFWRPYPRIVAMHLAVLAGGFGMHQLGYGRAIPVMIMIGLHLLIETMIWTHQLPSRGFLGGIRQTVNGGLAGAAMAFVPLIFLAGFGHWLLSIVGTLLAWFSSDLKWFGMAIRSETYFFRIGAFVLLMTFFAGLTGMVFGSLDHLKKLDGEKLSRRYVALLAFGILVIAGTLAALIPADVFHEASHQVRNGERESINEAPAVQ